MLKVPELGESGLGPRPGGTGWALCGWSEGDGPSSPIGHCSPYLLTLWFYLSELFSASCILPRLLHPSPWRDGFPLWHSLLWLNNNYFLSLWPLLGGLRGWQIMTGWGSRECGSKTFVGSDKQWSSSLQSILPATDPKTMIHNTCPQLTEDMPSDQLSLHCHSRLLIYRGRKGRMGLELAFETVEWLLWTGPLHFWIFS